MSRKLKIALFAGLAGLMGWTASNYLATGSSGLISSAEARIGRPLTPVSVAGATRRTVRRCAAGVYNC